MNTERNYIEFMPAELTELKETFANSNEFMLSQLADLSEALADILVELDKLISLVRSRQKTWQQIIKSDKETDAT
jgi:hypothetical protein